MPERGERVAPGSMVAPSSVPLPAPIPALAPAPTPAPAPEPVSVPQQPRARRPRRPRVRGPMPKPPVPIGPPPALHNTDEVRRATNARAQGVYCQQCYRSLIHDPYQACTGSGNCDDCEDNTCIWVSHLLFILHSKTFTIITYPHSPRLICLSCCLCKERMLIPLISHALA